MCTQDVYADVYPDGRRTEHVRPNLCDRSRHGQFCGTPVVYKHPTRYMQYGDLPSQHLYPAANLPPTPRLTPRSATPNHYRSGDESDRSHHSNSSAKKRSSGVYINGQKVLDLNRKHRKSGTERIVIVDSPPTQRTPPQQFVLPYTAPPSPNANMPLPYNIVQAAPRESAQRPVIVDERPRPHVSIEVINDRKPKHGHHRHPSNDSRHSHSSSGMSDEEKRRRRAAREDRIRAEDEIRRQKVRARIMAANDEINRRPVIPIPVAPKRSTTAYVRPAVEVSIPVDRERELVEAVRQLDLNHRRARERVERDEDEAQRRRLMERMQPRRRATVGPGSRRHRILYDDGLYRWE